MQFTDISQKPKGSLLLVEDEPFLLKYMETVLSRDGYEVRTAADAEEGWEQFQQEAARLDAVVTDICMPGDWDGLELARRVGEAAQDTPVLFVTGHAPEGPLGAHRSVLEKPFKPDQLRAAVARMVGARSKLVAVEAIAA